VLSALLTSDTIGDLSMRQEIWSRALTMMADFPFTGIGLGCFERLMGMLYPLFLAPKGTVTHAHNLFLQVGVDLGLPGLAAFALLLGLAFRSGLRAHRALAQERVDDLAALAAAGVASLAGICAHGMLDAAVWNNKGAFLPWVVMGLCVALGALHLPGCGAPPFVGQ